MIVVIPNTVLTTPANLVTKIDKKILSVVSDMKKTLGGTKNPKGVGLAAPQIGVALRIFITKPEPNSPIDVFLNPEILWQSPSLAEINREHQKDPSVQKDKKLEGCLSIPKIWGHLLRPEKVKLRFMDLFGKIQEKEYSGFMATVIQHETDHVNGILFTQRVLEQGQKLYRITRNKKGEEELVEISI